MVELLTSVSDSFLLFPDRSCGRRETGLCRTATSPRSKFAEDCGAAAQIKSKQLKYCCPVKLFQAKKLGLTPLARNQPF